MNARRLILATVVSLCSLVAVALLAVPAALAEELCPNAASRQGPSGALPDCRAYEMVTPLDQGDSPDLFPNIGLGNQGDATKDVGYAAEDGDHFLLNTEASFEGGDAFASSYVFSRGAEGWTTTSLSPQPLLPGMGVGTVEATVFNPLDLAEVGVEDLERNHIPGGPVEKVVVDFTSSPGGPDAPVSTFSEEEQKQLLQGQYSMAGASENLSHVLVESFDHELALGDTSQDGGRALYEWDGGGPCSPGTSNCRLVNVQTDGELVSQCGAALGQGLNMSGFSYHAVSSDGSKIIFTAPDPFAEGAPGCWNSSTEPQTNTPQLYMRVNGSTTVEISSPNRGVIDPHEQVAIYAGASADDSKVFFLTGSKLTADDPGEARELYEYDAKAPEGERVVRVSRGESGKDEGAVDFVGGVSSDGSAVYFTAYGVLAKGAPPNVFNEGLANLYRYDTVTRETTYIATVGAKEYPGGPFKQDGDSWIDGRAVPKYQYEEYWVASDATADWYVTGNGQYLIFPTSLPLTGFDNEKAPYAACGSGEGPGSSAIPDVGERCHELFRYSAAENSVVCVSCADGPPVDEARFDRSAFEVSDSAPPRPISEDGQYVFFESINALVPGTTDTKLHVYEWHGGRVSLISSPDDPGNAYFLGSSADGSNVFFGTHAQLVPQDTSFNGNLYDARIDGGFVSLTPPQCTGTGCQGVPGVPPIFATPSSVTFEGVGNFEPSVPVKTVKSKAKTLTSAQKLAKAMKACRSKPRSKRKRCDATARKRYGAGPKAQAKKSNRRGK